MSDLSLCESDSRASRCPMFSMPVGSYYMEDKVNVTLQMLYDRLVVDFNRMATEGVSTSHGVSGMTYKNFPYPIDKP